MSGKIAETGNGSVSAQARKFCARNERKSLKERSQPIYLFSELSRLVRLSENIVVDLLHKVRFSGF